VRWPRSILRVRPVATCILEGILHDTWHLAGTEYVLELNSAS